MPSVWGARRSIRTTCSPPLKLVIAGTEKKGTVLTEQEKKLIAYHEVGHALVAARQKGTEPVSKITIVPHTQGALGYTMQTAGGGEVPQQQGRTSQPTSASCWVAVRRKKLVFHTATTGASNDIERATDLARKMVTMFGMSDDLWHDGPGHRTEPVPGRRLTASDCAQDTAALADREIQKIS